MSRDSMVWLISFLRVKINDTDSSIWLDDELQNYLDMHRVHIVREPLSVPLSRGNSNEQVYYSTFGMLEADISLWDSKESNSNEIPNSNYTVNLVDGTFKFSAPLSQGQGNSYYLDAKSYNIHGAIAECLEQLAMDQNRAKAWSRGSVAYTHYDLMEMAKYHRNLMGLRSTGIVRTYIKK
ncbi:MAG: hypothetical protein QG641_2985 [Candidatus Poribacteria bacterium]|nr:hypothetical protein [Candidatus Poribacteria bacterium]